LYGLQRPETSLRIGKRCGFGRIDNAGRGQAKTQNNGETSHGPSCGAEHSEYHQRPGAVKDLTSAGKEGTNVRRCSRTKVPEISNLTGILGKIQQPLKK
jgi:hypothetical protein